jgi:uncharacterized protein (TIGR03067 family)
MQRRYIAALAFDLAMTACGANAPPQSTAASPRSSPASQAVVGRWALIALVRNGEDVTRGGVTQDGAVRYYTFKDDRTFLIQLGDSVTETGTWSIDTTVFPKTFDHTPAKDGRPGPLVPGIYEVGGDVLKISFLPPNAENKRPTQFEATVPNGSFLFILKRVMQ